MSFRVRWSQAAGALACGAFVLLAFQLGPELLQPPEPPPLAPDVGLPRVGVAPTLAVERSREVRPRRNLGRVVRGGGVRRRAEASEGKAPKRRPSRPSARRSAQPKPSTPTPRQDPPASPPDPEPIPASPPEPSSVVPPSPEPTPAPAAPEDGSIEFAPH